MKMGIRSSKPEPNTPVVPFNTEEFFENNEIQTRSTETSVRVPRNATHIEIDEPAHKPESSSQDAYSVISNDLYRTLYTPEVKTVHGAHLN